MKNFILNYYIYILLKNGMKYRKDVNEIFKKEFLQKLNINPQKFLNAEHVENLHRYIKPEIEKEIGNKIIIDEKFKNKFNNLKKRLEILENLSNKFKNNRKFVQKLLEKGNLYIVGGAVRDIISGKNPKNIKDIDLVTNLKPDEIIATLKPLENENKIEIKEVGKHFGVIMVVDNETKKEYEIATFRKDIYQEHNGKGAKEVEFTTLEEDAKRRDFTINSLYFSLKNMQLLDPNKNGIEDALNNKIRFVGNPIERIEEDYARILRVFKFMLKGFEADNKTLRVARTNFDKIKKISTERLRSEFEKNFVNYPLKKLKELKIFKQEEMKLLEELKKENENLKKENHQLKEEIEKLKQLLEQKNVLDVGYNF